jgi:hypothetical protein
VCALTRTGVLMVVAVHVASNATYLVQYDH